MFPASEVKIASPRIFHLAQHLEPLQLQVQDLEERVDVDLQGFGSQMYLSESEKA